LGPALFHHEGKRGLRPSFCLCGERGDCGPKCKDVPEDFVKDVIKLDSFSAA
jgi:hypothetical protein